MFCPNCGAEVQPGQKFCMSCGHKLVTDEASAPAAPEPAEAPVVEAGEVAEPSAPAPGPAEVTAAEAPEPADAPVPEGAEVTAAEAPEPAEPLEPVEVVLPESKAAEEAEAALFEVVEAVKHEVISPEPKATGVVVERIDLSSINAADSPAPSEADETIVVPAPATTVIPQAEPPRDAVGQQPAAPVPPQGVDATLVQPIPQPVSDPAPVTGSSSAGAQGSYGAPPAAAYTPQVVPAQAAKKKAWYSSPVVAVLAGLVAFGAAASIAFRAVGGLISSGGSHTEPSPIEEVKLDEDELESVSEDLSDVFEQIESSTPEKDSGSAPAYQGSEGEYLESHGYPTLLAFMELSGKDLASLVESNGYFFYDQDDSHVFAKRDGSIVFNVLTDSGYLDQDDYEDFSAGGKDEGAIFIAVLEGFDSPDAVLDGMANCVISERKAVSDKETVAVVYGPSMREYLADIYDVEDGDYEIDLYSPEAIEFGFFDVVNEGEFGTTASEVLKNFNG